MRMRFDACAADALLGQNVHSLVPLIEASMLVVSDGGTSGRGDRGLGSTRS